VYLLDAGIEKIKSSVSIMPKECKVIIRVPELGGCEMELRASENVELSEVKFKANGGNTIVELKLTKLNGETNEFCEVGGKDKFKGSYTGSFEIEKAEFK
jgi:hypothetical protein